MSPLHTQLSYSWKQEKMKDFFAIRRGEEIIPGGGEALLWASCLVLALFLGGEKVGFLFAGPFSARHLLKEKTCHRTGEGLQSGHLERSI
ncbi:unknown protein [Desulfotalea psychrophila LSv54]|uniref:Uncharacterized protein n=1 Tax=Desulfotalea psychrophila (strain LSv54 / DSM 12343) TaxID=177439 RepID=Q6ARP0_DESPS|nr:unknown protein [Desulfotalea psychrophila LSv54]